MRAENYGSGRFRQRGITPIAPRELDTTIAYRAASGGR